MKDTQSEKDKRGISLDKVGVKGILYPIKVWKKNTKSKSKLKVDTVANISMFVNVPHYQKGTHMSRFIEIINKYRGLINIANMKDILTDMRTALKAESAHMEVEFPYFLDKAAPKSGSIGEVSYICKFIGSYNDIKGYDFILEVKVPVMTVCPCSKNISEYGAHNQRGIIKAQVRWRDKLVWIEDLILAMESCASSPVYSILKRLDEKHVTEFAHKNPRFVEDVAREAAKLLWVDENIVWFNIEVENHESIHNHNTFAKIERNKEKNSKLETVE